MNARHLTLLLGLAVLGAAAAPLPAWADAADGYSDDSTGDGGGDGGEDGGDSAEEEDKGCAHLATPATGLSLLLGAALAFGLRRRTP
jgi:hypothetical protein